MSEEIDAGAPRYTSSTDGFLVGGHPELGDMVFMADGSEVGKVTFFYDHPTKTTYRVQVANHAEDPLLVVVAPVVAHEIVLGAKLVAQPGLASRAGDTSLGANVVITNA